MNGTNKNSSEKLLSIINKSKDPEKALEIALKTVCEFLSNKAKGEGITELESNRKEK